MAKTKKPPKIDWPGAIKPLLKKYKHKKHPLEAKPMSKHFTKSTNGLEITFRVINLVIPHWYQSLKQIKSKL